MIKPCKQMRSKDVKSLIERVLGDIVGRASLVDWSLDTAEDAFRTLYEFTIDLPMRRQLSGRLRRRPRRG
jgi:hypothetical protein